MPKLRVYQLARELNRDNSEIIRELQHMGVPVTSHSNTVEASFGRPASSKKLGTSKTGPRPLDDDDDIIEVEDSPIETISAEPVPVLSPIVETPAPKVEAAAPAEIKDIKEVKPEPKIEAPKAEPPRVAPTRVEAVRTEAVKKSSAPRSTDAGAPLPQELPRVEPRKVETKVVEEKPVVLAPPVPPPAATVATPPPAVRPPGLRRHTLRYARAGSNRNIRWRPGGQGRIIPPPERSAGPRIIAPPPPPPPPATPKTEAPHEERRTMQQIVQ